MKSIDDYVKALDEKGVELADYYSGDPIGLTLRRFGGFYWKLFVNTQWKELKSAESVEFTLVGQNYIASTSDVFNNWVFTCAEVEKCVDGPQTILSTTHRSADFPHRFFRQNRLSRENFWQKCEGISWQKIF